MAGEQRVRLNALRVRFNRWRFGVLFSGKGGDLVE